MVLLKKHVFSSLTYGSGERQPSGKRFPQGKGFDTVQVLKNERIQEYQMERTDAESQSQQKVDKSALLRQLAAMIVCRLVQVKQDRERAFEKKVED